MPTLIRRPLVYAISAIVFLVSAMPVWAADKFPSRYVQLVVPLAPGGGGDVVARLVAAQMSQSLGQSVVVENQPGAATMIGSSYVARAKPDGYTLLLATSSNAINGSFYKLPYDPVKSFEGVSVIGTTPGMLLAHPSVPVHNMKELIELAKAKPNSLNFASSGIASVPHLAGEMINRMAGIHMTHVPYKGGGPAELDLIGGQVQLYLASPVQAMAAVKAGKVRPIGMSSAKRSPAFPDIPAIAETLPGFEAVTFYVLLAPAGTPQPVIDKLTAAARSAVQQPAIAKQLADQGIDVVASDGPDATRFMQTQIDRWARIVKESNIKAE